MNRIKIEGHTELERDTKTHAIICSNTTLLQQAKASKQNKLNTITRLNTIEEKIETMQNTFDEILNILKGNN